MKKDEEDWSNDDMAFVEQQRSSRRYSFDLYNDISKVQKMYEEALNKDVSVNAPNLSDDEAAYEYDMEKIQREKYDTDVKPLGISESDYYKAWKAQSGKSEYDGKKNKTNFERAVNIMEAVPEDKLDAYREVFKLNKSDILKAKDAQRLGDVILRSSTSKTKARYGTE